MLTSLEYKRVNKQTRSVRVRRVFKVRNFRTRREVRGLGLGLEVVHFSKNSKNDIQFFKNSKKFLLHILYFSNHCFWFKRPLLRCIWMNISMKYWIFNVEFPNYQKNILKHFEQCIEKQPCIWSVILVFFYVPKFRKQDWKSFQSLPASIIQVYCIGSNMC
jgi:hypothetical protein